MACNWAPHNLTEVGNLILSYLNTNTLDLCNMAPDFPTGGIIINKKDLSSIYTTGKGKIVIRGKYEIETRARKKLIVFTQIPYGVKTEDLLEQINEASTKEEIVGVDEVRDEGGKKGLRVVFELSKDISEGSVLKQIFAHTDLQKTFSVNQVALVDKVPTQLNWKDCIDIYINRNLECIKREAEFDLTKVKARLEVVDGLLKALEDIDNIIALIKRSKSAAAAKENLMDIYKFTESQAKAIVDMKLGKLASLEKVELQNEFQELIQKAEELTALVSNEEKQKEELVIRLSSFIKKYGDARKTEVSQIDIKPEEKEIATVVSEDVVVMVSESGLIKKIPAASIKVQKKAGRGIKSQDDAVMAAIKTNTIDTLMFFSNAGKMYRLIVDNVPSGTNVSKGVPISTLISLDSGEKIIATTSLHRKSTPKYAIFITKKGMFKKTYLEEYMKAKRNTGMVALNVKEGDSLVKVIFQDEEEMILVSKQGMSIRFKTKDVAPIGRVTMGVKGINLKEGDEVVAALPIHKNTDNIAVFSATGLGRKTDLKEFAVQTRGGKGQVIYKPTTSSGDIIGAAMVSQEDNILIIGASTTICVSAEDIPLAGKANLGNILIKNNRVTSIVKI